MDSIIIFCAKYLVYIVAACGAAYLFFTHELKRFTISAVFSLGLSYALGWLAGHLWYNARPFVADGTTPLVAHAADNGFPSDHMLLAAAVASVVFAYNRTLGVILWVLALAVGASRVLAGVHHVVDVAASALIAVIAVAVVEYCLNAWSAGRAQSISS